MKKKCFKESFDSTADALRAAELIEIIGWKEVKKGKKIRAYWCPFHKAWHWGHRSR
jgi:hypothetical protein